MEEDVWDVCCEQTTESNVSIQWLSSQRLFRSISIIGCSWYNLLGDQRWTFCIVLDFWNVVEEGVTGSSGTEERTRWDHRRPPRGRKRERDSRGTLSRLKIHDCSVVLREDGWQKVTSGEHRKWVSLSDPMVPDPRGMRRSKKGEVLKTRPLGKDLTRRFTYGHWGSRWSLGPICQWKSCLGGD